MTASILYRRDVAARILQEETMLMTDQSIAAEH
ncbi:hypothetical protein C8R31_101567 [Nitrosospira sp. Nsp2]|jgi:hypothetical protein|nr:hypothetical protein C8R31_101567 [Nitrosospira sp. Nsp2]